MNDLWKAVGVSVLTSVVVFFILYFAVGQVMFSPLMPATPTTREINANSCNADGVCETNGLQITSLESEIDGVGAYVCIASNGGVTRSAIPCTAYTGNCLGFDELESITLKSLLSESGESVQFRELETVFEDDYLVVPGRILRVQRITNSSGGYISDVVEFKDIVEDVFYRATIQAEGIGIVDIDGQTYSLEYWDDRDGDNDEYVVLDYPQTTENEKKLDLSACF